MYTDFVQIHLGKTISEIDEAFITDYFSQDREESLTLEFKSYRHSEKLSYDNVLRTVAAFLNSEGGLLIFGAPTEVAIREKYRVVKGPPTTIPTSATSKDSLVRSISDNISYMPVGIRVEPIEMTGGRFVYLIEVQESFNKPHQQNKQYPIRLDGQSTSAPHYLVEALFKQVSNPELSGFLRFTSYRFITANSLNDNNKVRLSFNFGIFNASRTINDSGVYIHISASKGTFLPERILPNYDFKGSKIFVTNASILITHVVPTVCLFDYQVSSDDYKLLNNDEEIEIEVLFGSSKSIPRKSVYYFNFKDISGKNLINKEFTRPIDLNSLISIRKDENILIGGIMQVIDDNQHLSILGGI